MVMMLMFQELFDMKILCNAGSGVFLGTQEKGIRYVYDKKKRQRNAIHSLHFVCRTPERSGSGQPTQESE